MDAADLVECPQEQSLEWACPVAHGIVSTIRMNLIAKLAGSKRIPKCQIEVFAEGEGTQLAYCKGSILLGNSCARVAWLGRSGNRPVHDSIRSKPSTEFVGAYEEVASVPSTATTVPCRNAPTVAQSVLGLLAIMSERLGAVAVDMLVDDDGSGRLVRYYGNIGLEASAHVEGETYVTMRGATAQLARLAPIAWRDSLVPADFNAIRWFCRLTSPAQTAGPAMIRSRTQPSLALFCKTTPQLTLARWGSVHVEQRSSPACALADRVGGAATSFGVLLRHQRAAETMIPRSRVPLGRLGASQLKVAQV